MTDAKAATSTIKTADEKGDRAATTHTLPKQRQQQQPLSVARLSTPSRKSDNFIPKPPIIPQLYWGGADSSLGRVLEPRAEEISAVNEIQISKQRITPKKTDLVRTVVRNTYVHRETNRNGQRKENDGQSLTSWTFRRSKTARWRDTSRSRAWRARSRRSASFTAFTRSNFSWCSRNADSRLQHPY